MQLLHPHSAEEAAAYLRPIFSTTETYQQVPSSSKAKLHELFAIWSAYVELEIAWPRLVCRIAGGEDYDARLARMLWNKSR